MELLEKVKVLQWQIENLVWTNKEKSEMMATIKEIVVFLEKFDAYYQSLQGD